LGLRALIKAQPNSRQSRSQARDGPAQILIHRREVAPAKGRRRWSKEAKAAIAAETYASVVSVSEVTQRLGIALPTIQARLPVDDFLAVDFPADLASKKQPTSSSALLVAATKGASLGGQHRIVAAKKICLGLPLSKPQRGRGDHQKSGVGQPSGTPISA